MKTIYQVLLLILLGIWIIFFINYLDQINELTTTRAIVITLIGLVLVGLVGGTKRKKF